MIKKSFSSRALRSSRDHFLENLHQTHLYLPQKSFCDELSAIEGRQFTVDRWNRPFDSKLGSPGGGGITCILQDGDVFEKAGKLKQGDTHFCRCINDIP